MTLDTTTLGRTGLTVSRLCFGTGSVADDGEDAAVRLIHEALDGGINFIDTADIYSSGRSEEVVGAALRGRRDDVVITTKFWGPLGPGSNERGVSRRWIMQAIEGSLRRLGTDYIDIYQQHRPEHDVDLDEVLGALTDLVHAGKVRYLGASTFPAEMIVEAEWVAERRGRERMVCHEVPYSILIRSVEAAVLPTCTRFGAGVITYSPLAGGWLGGRHRRATGISTDTKWARIVPARFDPASTANDRKLDAVEALVPLADEAGLSLPQFAIAWVLEHPAVSSVIIGPNTSAQLASLLPAAGMRLDADLLDRVDRIVVPGTTVDPIDDQWTPPDWDEARPSVYPRLPALRPESRRRAARPS